MLNDDTPQSLILPGSLIADPQAKPRFLHKYLHFDSYMHDVPPWGIVLPMERTETAYPNFHVEFATIGLPAETMLGMRWAPASGNNIHTRSIRLVGGQTSNTQLAIEESWLIESEGQSVLVEHEIVWPDGRVMVGEPVTVHVPRKLVFSGMTAEGLEHEGTLDGALFPDGIRVSIGPVANIREYNTVMLMWVVSGVTGPVTSAIYRRYFNLPGKEGDDYSFLIPPAEYEDVYDPKYERLSATLWTFIKMAPEPNEQLYNRYAWQRFNLLRTISG